MWIYLKVCSIVQLSKFIIVFLLSIFLSLHFEIILKCISKTKRDIREEKWNSNKKGFKEANIQISEWNFWEFKDLKTESFPLRNQCWLTFSIPRLKEKLEISSHLTYYVVYEQYVLWFQSHQWLLPTLATPTFGSPSSFSLLWCLSRS